MIESLGWVRGSVAILCAGLLLSACGDGDRTSTTTEDTSRYGMGDTSSVSSAAPTLDTATTATPVEPAMTDANIFAKMSLADSMEIKMGKMAQKKTKNADVKSYAGMMVTDHTKMKKEGGALAKSLGIMPELPANDGSAAEMMAGMHDIESAVDAAAFDRAYMDHAVNDHQKVLDAMNMMQGQAQNDSLKALIGRAIPVVQKHLDKAKEIQGKMQATAMK